MAVKRKQEITCNHLQWICKIVVLRTLEESLYIAFAESETRFTITSHSIQASL